MPEVKGKRRNRSGVRRQRASSGFMVTEEVGQPASTPAKQARPVARRRNMPMGVNITVGTLMILSGVVFTVSNWKHMPIGWSVALLLAYVAVGSWYLWRAYRQYRERQRT